MQWIFIKNNRADLFLGKAQNIQALRGIAVLFVVFFHLLSIEKKYGGTVTLLPDILEFGMFGVDLFFVISGFVMIAVTRGKFQNAKRAMRFLYHRISRIYPLYWVYSLLVLAVFLIKPSLVNSSQGGQVDVLASFLLLPSETLPLVMVGWTLIHEMYFYGVFFLVLLLVSERCMPVAMLVWAAGVVFLNVFLDATGASFRVISHPLTIEFIGGCLLAMVFFRGRKRVINARWSIFFAFVGMIFSLCGYLFYRQITGHIEPQDWWRLLIFGLPALMTVFFFIHAERSGYLLHSSLMTVGNASYSIYLSHILTLSAAGRLWSLFSSNGVVDNIIMLPVLVGWVLVVGLASYRFIEKPLLVASRKVA